MQEILPEIYEFEGIKIPERIMRGLRGYILDHQQVGSFLQAVIANDLKTSIMRADDESFKAIKAIIGLLYWEAPGNCWGSPDVYREWIKK